MPAWADLAPLLRLRPIYRSFRLMKNRLRKSEPERVKKGIVSKSGQRGGPLKLDVRLAALEQVLAIQAEVNPAATALNRSPLDILVDLIDDAFDAVFRAGPRADDGLAAVELSPLRLISCASPDHVARRGVPVSPADLLDHECVGHAHWSPPANFLWRFAIGGKIEEVPAGGRLSVNDAQALLTAALAGFGIVFVPYDLARETIGTGRLSRVLPDCETSSRPMHLLFRADRRQTPKLRSFINATIAAFPPN